MENKSTAANDRASKCHILSPEQVGKSLRGVGGVESSLVAKALSQAFCSCFCGSTLPKKSINGGLIKIPTQLP